MNEQTIQLLRDLAEQLGTSVDKLLEIYARQAYMSALEDALSALLLFILAYGCYRLARSFAQDLKDSEPGDEPKRSNYIGDLDRDDPGYYDQFERYNQAMDDWREGVRKYNDTKENTKIGAGVFFVLTCVAVFVALDTLINVPAKLLNPEYWAIQEILKMLADFAG